MAVLKALFGVARLPFLALPVTLVAAGAAAADLRLRGQHANSLLAQPLRSTSQQRATA